MIGRLQVELISKWYQIVGATLRGCPSSGRPSAGADPYNILFGSGLAGLGLWTPDFTGVTTLCEFINLYIFFILETLPQKVKVPLTPLDLPKAKGSSSGSWALTFSCPIQ
jgi:hypothetical protein